MSRTNLSKLKYDILSEEDLDLTIDTSELNNMSEEIDAEEKNAEEIVKNVVPEEYKEEEDLALQIKKAKDNFNAMLKPVKDKINEYKEIIFRTLSEYQNKLTEWTSKGKYWVACHKASIKREVKNIKGKIIEMITAAQTWIYKQIERIKKDLARALADINRKWKEKIDEKAKLREEAAKKKAEEKIKVKMMKEVPPTVFSSNNENLN